jgi:hypothetical protein
MKRSASLLKKGKQFSGEVNFEYKALVGQVDIPSQGSRTRKTEDVEIQCSLLIDSMMYKLKT